MAISENFLNLEALTANGLGFGDLTGFDNHFLQSERVLKF